MTRVNTLEHNPVTFPKHYQFNAPLKEVRDIINDRNAEFIKSKHYDPDIVYDYDNAIKYILRWFAKNGTEDLEKAQQCISTMLNTINASRDSTYKSAKREFDLPADKAEFDASRWGTLLPKEAVDKEKYIMELYSQKGV